MPWPFGGGRWFPGTNLQDLNLDWIIRRIRDLSKGIIAPWINPDNHHWMVYDVEQEEFVDSGVSASGEGVGPPGPGVSPGGNTGDVLFKKSAANYDTGWTNTPALMNNFAAIEKSPVENTIGYQIGDYLVYNGQLYKVTAAISQGQTLTPGTNVEAAFACVRDIRESTTGAASRAFDINTNIELIQRIIYNRLNGIVTLDIMFKTTAAITTNTELFKIDNIPEPANESFCMLYSAGLASPNGALSITSIPGTPNQVKVLAAGTINVGSYIRGYLSYIIK